MRQISTHSSVFFIRIPHRYKSLVFELFGFIDENKMDTARFCHMVSLGCTTYKGTKTRILAHFIRCHGFCFSHVCAFDTLYARVIQSHFPRIRRLFRGTQTRKHPFTVLCGCAHAWKREIPPDPVFPFPSKWRIIIQNVKKFAHSSG